MINHKALLLAGAALVVCCQSAFAQISIDEFSIIPKKKPIIPQPIIAQYVGIWHLPEIWGKKFRDDTPFDKLTRVYISFAKIIPTSDGHFDIDYDIEKETEKNKIKKEVYIKPLIKRIREMNPKAEIFISLGGSSSDFISAAKDEKFVSNVLGFMQREGFIGLDLDWETDDIDKAQLNALVKKLATAFHRDPKNYKKLTLDFLPGPYSIYDMKTLGQYLDQGNLMSYGKSRPLTEFAGEMVKAGFPASKIIAGIEVEPNYPEGGTDTLGPNGSIATKAKYVLAKETRLAGMMEWRLDNDYPCGCDPEYPTYRGAYILWDAMTQPKK